MKKSLASTAILTLSLFDQASTLGTLSTFVDEIPELAGIPEYPNTEIPWEFPLTEEDTIKM